MAPQVWIGMQVFIDLIMVGLLVWFLRAYGRRQASWHDHEAAMQKAQAILEEMKEISRALEVNLKEKKELSARILGQLEQGLSRAEAYSAQISEILPRTGRTVAASPGASRDAERTRTSIDALLAKGLPREEVARHLGLSVGEIELLLKLRPRQEKGVGSRE
ncbi:MAG: hypothetical protein AB1512_28575 [Thermodesulfobacteriota bacterium]